MPAPYDAISSRYDAHGWDWYAATFGERLVDLLAARGTVPGAGILDAGCGTGTLALLLADRGYRVTGVDLSPGMIDRARAKDTDRRVDWRVGDLRTLELGADFDAVVSVADVLNHLRNLDEWESVFRAFHLHLRPGGLALADVMTCRGLSQMDQHSVQERGAVTWILSVVWEPVERRSTLKTTSFFPSEEAGGLYVRASETIVEWGQPCADVIERIRRAGFTAAERVWGTSEDPEDDDRMTVLARS